MRAVSDDVTGQILNHGVGYVAWKIAQDTSASDASRRKIIEEFLRYVPFLLRLMLSKEIYRRAMPLNV